jgi:hypothetical protein
MLVEREQQENDPPFGGPYSKKMKRKMVFNSPDTL